MNCFGYMNFLNPIYPSPSTYSCVLKVQMYYVLQQVTVVLKCQPPPLPAPRPPAGGHAGGSEGPPSTGPPSPVPSALSSDSSSEALPLSHTRLGLFNRQGHPQGGLYDYTLRFRGAKRVQGNLWTRSPSALVIWYKALTNRGNTRTRFVPSTTLNPPPSTQRLLTSDPRHFGHFSRPTARQKSNFCCRTYPEKHYESKRAILLKHTCINLNCVVCV